MKKREELIEALTGSTLGLFALSVGFLFPLLTLGVLVYESLPAIEKFGLWRFITGTTWDPVAEVFGALPALFGTLLVTFLASIVALPVSIGIAVFISELSPKRLKPVFSTAVELLGAIPSIIYGMWGLFVIAPLMADYVEPFLQETLGRIPLLGRLFEGAPTGVDALTSSFVLSIMIIPFMSAIVKDSFEMTPPLLKEAGYGLGATKWEVVKNIVIPYALPGIVGGMVLSVGRALGETMAVAFLTGNVHQIPFSLLEPLTTITVSIANEFTEADSDIYLSSLYYLALILFVLSFGLLMLAKFLILERLGKRWGTKNI
ncbi:phosphate ABC transporter permease subunit PstC [Hydrogenivirga sp. 128-5-R1-1]|uniref:phosphate ABC transporter permease subunit PstC n=1 Tax=Hydrogenivirga sp. 128-5-R1-1 TaxID=392423 RepID=UPI00015F16D0|nr:phosphate ABC transporter permease subunit PstC [Hydrogenivirga sp. 128-5-R1-1]EDP76025.1 phosphate transport system permease protein C [Hydrogenivirga sp. 128-5-R1-1]